MRRVDFLFLMSFFLNRWYIMTRLPWQWIYMNNVAVLYPSKSYFVLKHSQMVFVQFWSLQILPAWQKFGCSTQKEVMHSVLQDCKNVDIPGLPRRNFTHLGSEGTSWLRAAVGYCVTPWQTKLLQEIENCQADAARTFMVGGSTRNFYLGTPFSVVTLYKRHFYRPALLLLLQSIRKHLQRCRTARYQVRALDQHLSGVLFKVSCPNTHKWNSIRMNKQDHRKVE